MRFHNFRNWQVLLPALLVLAIVGCEEEGLPSGYRIVFDSTRKLDGTDAANGTSNIWGVNANGVGATPITTAVALFADSQVPQCSPDGSQIVFESSRKLDGTDEANLNGSSNVWRVNADGSALMPLTRATAAGVSVFGPQWSPDGTRIVFSSRIKLDGTDAINSNYTDNIWRVNVDGSDLTPLTNATVRDALSGSPQWSPDGTRIVFSSRLTSDGADGANMTYNIWQVNVDGSGLVPLTRIAAVGGDSFSPQWSPDSSKIIFWSGRKLDRSNGVNLNGTRNIWRMNADGTDLTPLTTVTASGAHSFAPQWSPDGNKIVFYSRRKLDGTDAVSPNGTLNIWRVNADGTGLAVLTSGSSTGADSDGPQWSPDGKIVFHSRRKLDGSDGSNQNGTYNIWQMNVDGTGLVPLTKATTSLADSSNPQFQRTR